MVLFFLFILCACKKEKCYDCVQKIKWTCNKNVSGYPKESKIKLVSCGDNIHLIDNPEPIIYRDTVGDTIYTYWKDTDCKPQRLF
jgi:hypothetical protein